MPPISVNLVAPVEFGQSLTIAGRTGKAAKSFEVNLSNDRLQNDVPLLIRFCFPENEVVRNTKLNGKPGSEEKSSHNASLTNPFKAGHEFLLHILIGVDRFHISMNNIHFCDYLYRTGLNRISYVQVLQDIEVVKQIDHRRVFPAVHPLAHGSGNASFSNDIPTPLTPGDVFLLKANTSGNSKGSFVIKFLVDGTEKQAFHMSVRFPPSSSIVRNHTCNDKREFNPKEEERNGGFPLSFGKIFKIAVGCGEKAFRIAINGTFYCEYSYKAKLGRLSGIKCSENDGLILSISELEHLRLDKSLKNFEIHSSLAK